MTTQRSLSCFWGLRDGEVGVALSEPRAPNPANFRFATSVDMQWLRALAAQRPNITL
jgi:hypothetical protein